MARPTQPHREQWAVGMALVRGSREMQAEAYSQELIAGLSDSLAANGGSFLVTVVPDEASERAIFEHWATSGRVESVVIEDHVVDDTRLDLLQELGLGVTVVGDVEVAGDHPAIWTDHAGAMRLALEQLHALGHRKVGHVSGPMRYLHSIARSRAFFAVADELGLDVREAIGDYSRGSGTRATRELLDADPDLTALLFGNDFMALGGLGELGARGLSSPEDVSIVAWDDSVRCQMALPPLAALSHDVRQIGQIAGEATARARRGEVVRIETPPPTFVSRQSAGPPPALGRRTASARRLD